VAIAEATAEGVGIAVPPDVIVAHYVETGGLEAIMTDWSLPSVGIFVVRPPGQHLGAESACADRTAAGAVQRR
jgi:DNA-binding transcriptional LysR family regulator